MTGGQITPPHRPDVHIVGPNNTILQVVRPLRPVTGQEIMNALRSIRMQGTRYIARQVSPRNGIPYFQIGRQGEQVQQHCIVRAGEDFTETAIAATETYTTFALGEHVWGNTQVRKRDAYRGWISATCEQLYLHLPK